MKRLLALLLTAAIAVSVFAGCSGGSGQKETDGTFKIITTIYPIYDWVRNIADGAENVEVSMLSNNGADMHSFQPTAEDMVNINTCDFFVYVGGESDRWVSDAVGKMTAGNPEKVNLSLVTLLGDKVKEEEEVEGMQEEDGSDEEPELDEHVWLSLRNASFLCEKLTGQLKTANAANAEKYDENSKVYIEKLNALDKSYTDSLKNTKYDTLLFGDRFPFRYLVDDYDISYYAAFAGCSAESEASFETVAFLSEKLRELQLPAVMTIDGSDQKLAKTIVETSESADTGILMLHSMQSKVADDVDYLGVMQSNLEVLKEALN